MNKTLVTIAMGFSMVGQALANTAPDYSHLFQKTKDAVVSVEVETVVAQPKMRMQVPPGFPPELFGQLFGMPSPFDEQPEDAPTRKRTGQGSGFIIDGDGYILTNAHVVNGADTVKVKLVDRHEYKAKVVGIDKRTDVALLKIDGKNLPVAQLGNSDDVQVGDWVMAIGAPFGFTQTATHGIISAVSRSLPDGTYVPFIQTDAAVNPGNSGGPLFNADGEVIGINSQIYSRSGGFNGLAFSIPINVAKNVAEQLRKTGKVERGWLGVAIQGLNQELAKSFKMENPEGALVTNVQPDSPAQKAGIHAGDVIIAYNGKTIEKSSDLPPLVALTPIGNKAVVTVLRNGKQQDIDVVVGNLDRMNTGNASDPSSIHGLQLKSLSKAQRQAFALPKGGVLIEHVKAKSAAAQAGIRKGDVLLAVGNQQVDTPAEAKKLLSEVKEGAIALLIKRDANTTLYLPLIVK